MKKIFTLVAATLATSAFAALTSVPASADQQTWYFNGSVVYPSEDVINKEVQVAIDGTDLYLYINSLYSGVDAWAKGTSADGVNYTFQSQDLGSLWGYAVSFSGVDDWNPVTAAGTLADGVLSFQTGIGIIYTDYPDASPVIWWQPGVTISTAPQEYQEPVITDQTASVPYKNNFDSEAKRAQVATYTTNSIGWDWAADWNTGNWYATSNNDNYLQANNYLVMPGLTLEAGTTYVMSFDASSTNSNWQYYEVLMGTEGKLSALTQQLMPSSICNSDSWELVEKEFTVGQTGTYYIAIHCTSYGYSGFFNVDNFAVETLDTEKPMAADAVTVTPGSKGALQATISFSMPGATIGGTAYDSSKQLSYTVTRGDFIVADGQAAASQLVFVTDDGMGLTNGFATYKVVIKDENHVSKDATATAYIGVDFPTETEYIEITHEGNLVTIAWVPVTRGANGGYVGAKYNVYACPAKYQRGEKLNAEPLTECVFTFEYDVEGGEQGDAWFSVTAVNDLDESYGAYESLSVGAPYALPYADSFAEADTHVWTFGGDGGSSYIDRWGTYSSDGDGSSLYLYVWSWNVEESVAEAQTGKIYTAPNAQMSFDYKVENGGAKLMIAAKVGAEAIPVTPEAIELEAGSEGTIVLNDIFGSVPGQPSVSLLFTGCFETSYQGMFIDNLQIEEIAVPTGINQLESQSAEQIYSLDGKLINARPAAGFYIQNGKKMMVK